MMAFLNYRAFLGSLIIFTSARAVSKLAGVVKADIWRDCCSINLSRYDVQPIKKLTFDITNKKILLINYFLSTSIKSSKNRFVPTFSFIS
jgi:hypothetical protein